MIVQPDYDAQSARCSDVDPHDCGNEVLRNVLNDVHKCLGNYAALPKALCLE